MQTSARALLIQRLHSTPEALLAMAAVQEAGNLTVDVEKVAALLSDFKYSEALADESTAEEIKGHLRSISIKSCEAKASIQTQMQSAVQASEAAELALDNLKASERDTVSELESKVNTLVDVQVELQSVQDEKKKVELEGQEELLMGDELREAKKHNISITEQIFGSLLQGSEDEEMILSLKNYLQEIGTETWFCLVILSFWPY